MVPSNAKEEFRKRSNLKLQRCFAAAQHDSPTELSHIFQMLRIQLRRFEHTVNLLTSSKRAHAVRPYNAGKGFTILTVSRLTRITWPTSRTMYSGSSGRFGSERMPLCLSSVTWYWSITHSSALRLPRRYSKASGGMPHRVSESFTLRDLRSLESRILSSTR